MAAAARLEQLEEQMKALQAEMSQVKDDIKENEVSEWEGANNKIEITIGNKLFMSSTKVLLNTKRFGKTLFYIEFTGKYKNRNNAKDCVVTKNNNNNNDNNNNNGNKIGERSDNVNDESSSASYQLYFDRNPALFGYIIDYMRGYTMDYKFSKLNGMQLRQLIDDCLYYNIISLYNILKRQIASRFDELNQSPLIELSNDGRVAKRINENVNAHVSVALCEMIKMPNKGKTKRYFEFNIISHGNRYIMIGATEATPSVKLGPYPGHGTVSGFSLYGANGHFYRGGASEPWSAAWTYGDIIGMLIKMDQQDNSATLTYYQNRKQVKSSINLKNYLDINKGIKCIVNMHSAFDTVSIVQNPQIPD